MYLPVASGWKAGFTSIATRVWTDEIALGTAGSAYNTTRTSTMTIGTASATRTVIMAICTLEDGDALFSSVTIGGVSATKRLEHFQSSGGRIAFWTAAVTTGTTASTTVTFDRNVAASGWEVYAAYDLASPVPVLTATSIADPATSGSLNIGGGFGIGAGIPGPAGGATPNWTGFTQDSDEYIYDTSRRITVASGTSAGSITASNDWAASSSTGRVSIFAVWR